MKIIYSAQYKQTSLLGKRPLIEAIRNHPKVGNGSLTSIDEAMTDMEIAVELEKDGVYTTEGAIKWALEREETLLEKGLNARWGEDDDPQLQRYNQWIGEK